MHRLKSLIVACCFAFAGTTPVFAQGTGFDGYFTITNVTDGNIVVGFYTNEGGGWSDNWLYEELWPGDVAQMEFYNETGSCEMTVQVGWLADDDTEILDQPIYIDICDASHLYLDDNEIYYE